MTQADENANLSDFFFTDGSTAGQLKPGVVYGTVNQVDENGNPVPPANTINWGATERQEQLVTISGLNTSIGGHSEHWAAHSLGCEPILGGAPLVLSTTV